ncbi:MAG: hypothetical protein GY801_04700 [bacterium]|nr:hypothetical protein [bacterium]
MENGEDEWQKLQALVYGAEIQEAKLIRGVQEFFKLCHYHNINVYIVSHKTEFANRKDIRTNLREAALSWMREKKFFDVDGLHLPLEKVYFEATRRGKIERVKQLGCTHFIDDLEEIFHEHSFPKDVIRILYDPYQEKTFLPGMQIFPTWDGIIGYLGL